MCSQCNLKNNLKYLNLHSGVEGCSGAVDGGSFVKDLTHSGLTYTRDNFIENPACTRFKQTQCYPAMQKGIHTWRIKVSLGDSNLMVGVAQKNNSKDTVDLYDKLTNIKTCVN